MLGSQEITMARLIQFLGSPEVQTIEAAVGALGTTWQDHRVPKCRDASDELKTRSGCRVFQDRVSRGTSGELVILPAPATPKSSLRNAGRG